MTGPDDPGDDWGFPEVDPAGPSSTALPEPEPEEQVIYDTGSDAWWRAQAEAQRNQTPSPLDDDWMPPDLPELRPPVVTPPAVTESYAPETDVAPEPTPVQELSTAFVDPVDEEVVEVPEWYAATPVEHDEPVSEDAGDGTDAAYAVEEAYVDDGLYVAEPDGVAVSSEVDEAYVEESAVLAEDPQVRTPYEPQPVSRARALAGGALALAGVALAIVALFVLNGKDDSKNAAIVVPPTTSPKTSAAVTTQPTTNPSPTVSSRVVVPPVTKTSAAPAALVPISVLNNSKTKGLAKTAAAHFQAGGWQVTKTGNYNGVIQQTTVYYGSGQEASAKRFAAQFGIARVLPRSALPGIPVPGMTVVLTRTYQP